eukprot:1946966-Pyramimonas_sp.AAC.1
MRALVCWVKSYLVGTREASRIHPTCSMTAVPSRGARALCSKRSGQSFRSSCSSACNNRKYLNLD